MAEATAHAESESNEGAAPKLNDVIRTDYMAGLSYEDLLAKDKIEVELALEKKGIFGSFQEYYVKSEKLKSCVERRYSDFVSFHEILLATYPYRLVPKLPPKKAMLGANDNFIEERRSSLKRWLALVSQHPILGSEATTRFFLTFTGPKMHVKIQEIFKSQPDEFVISCIASKAKELAESISPTLISYSRSQIQLIFSCFLQLKKIADKSVLRSQEYALDMAEVGNQLLKMACDPQNATEWGAEGTKVWEDTKRGFGAISNDFSNLYTKACSQAVRQQVGVCEMLNLLIDLLTGHQLLCDRFEKGVALDHQRALEKMLAYKKAKIQRSISGTTDADVLNQLEARMEEQENVIANVEMRSAYFLHCMKLETQLVQVYLGSTVGIINSLISVQYKGHSEMASVWETMLPKLHDCLPGISGCNELD